MTLHLDDDALVACVACGLCLPHCPTYRVTGLEIASPRGRIAAMRAVQHDGAPIDDAFTDAMDACVQCRGCEAACPSGVAFGELMEDTRAHLHATRRPGAAPPRTVGFVRSGADTAPSRTNPGRVGSTLETIGYRWVLPHRAVLRMVTWVLWLAQRLQLVPARLGLPHLSRRDLTARLAADPDPDAVLFTGCVMDAWQRPVHRAALRVMRATGARVAPSAERGPSCCGALHVHAGRIEEARTLARRLVASLPGDVPIVVDSAGCGAAMRDYGRLLDTREAEEFAARVVDFSTWLTERGMPATTPTGRTVVVQDPCHLRHVQHAEQPVHDALTACYDVVGTDDDGLCCGAGGAYAALHPELAGEIRARKVDAIRRAACVGDPGATVLVASANPGCAMHLGAVPGLEVRHPAELVEEALVSERREPGIPASSERGPSGPAPKAPRAEQVSERREPGIPASSERGPSGPVPAERAAASGVSPDGASRAIESAPRAEQA